MIFSNKTFKNETIDLDFNKFRECSFVDCKITYRGFGTFELSNCQFDRVSWNFADAAAHTLSFLKSMYHGSGEGGKKLVEDTFHNIRNNAY
jgi:hypothetical protein